jgi:putative toxin-antitoxin system antitoxin component (TIGR02293 family)
MPEHLSLYLCQMTLDMKKYPEEDKMSDPLIHEPVAAYLKTASDCLRPEVVQYARQGLSAAYVLSLADQLVLSIQELSDILHISVRTIQRWEHDKILDVDLSSKAILLARLQHHGARVFGEGDSLGNWLHTPVPALHGCTPLSYLDTPFGFDIIHQVLGRIEEGVFA